MPLGEIKDAQKRLLCKELWSWKLCEGCEADEECDGDTCPSDRLRHLGAFFAHFESIVATYDAVESSSRSGALRSMEDLLGAVRKVKNNCNKKRRDAIPIVFAAAHTSKSHAGQDDRSDQAEDRKEVALNMLVEMAFLINCAGPQTSISAVERGEHANPWTKDLSLASFIDRAFPRTELSSDRKTSNAVDFEGNMTAHVLRREANVRLQPTSNLRNHLKLDRKTGVLEVFHHVAFLKEQLRLSMSFPANCSTAESLKQGALPRNLVLETLNTLQKVLFPQDDPKSRRLLRSLCSSHDFDDDCLRFEWTAIRLNTEKEHSYSYWYKQLEVLREEVENPRPQGVLELWLERRSAPRYVMLATLVGVIIAILLGAAALAVSSYQTYIAYNAWKYPVAPPTG